MAFADYTFYQAVYHGDVLTESNADRWLERASDELDFMTSSRLTFAFPSNDVHIKKVKKAVCAVADAMCLIESQQNAVMAQRDNNGNFHGAVSSISSGRESISYASIGGSASSSVYAQAATNTGLKNKLLRDAAASYIAGVPDAYGINLLYMGA